MTKKKERSTTAKTTKQIRNPGLPDKRSIVSERPFVSPKGGRYRIITTNQRDPYDPGGNKDDKRSN